jgi:hypothetical protein
MNFSLVFLWLVTLLRSCTVDFGNSRFIKIACCVWRGTVHSLLQQGVGPDLFVWPVMAVHLTGHTWLSRNLSTHDWHNYKPEESDACSPILCPARSLLIASWNLQELQSFSVTSLVEMCFVIILGSISMQIRLNCITVRKNSVVRVCYNSLMRVLQDLHSEYCYNMLKIYVNSLCDSLLWIFDIR